MNETSAEAWTRIRKHEPRVNELMAVAEATIMNGQAGTHHADLLYCDLKPFLMEVVGWRRSRGNPQARNRVMSDHERKFAEIVETVWVAEGQEEFLRSQWAYDTAVTWVMDRLCTVYAQTHEFDAA